MSGILQGTKNNLTFKKKKLMVNDWKKIGSNQAAMLICEKKLTFISNNVIDFEKLYLKFLLLKF